MTWLVVLAGIIYVFGVGYLFVSRVDRWMNSAECPPSVKEERGASFRILMFGEKARTKDLCCFFSEKQISAIAVDDMVFKREWRGIRYILALSGSDVDNLSFCKIGKKFYQPELAFSVCNEEENRKLFAKNEIYVLNGDEIGQENIYRLLAQAEGEALA